MSFRSRMLLLMGLSLLPSGFITYVLYRILQEYYHRHAFQGDSLARLRLFMNTFGDLNFFLLIFVPLAVLFFFLFTKPYVAYFSKISSGIHHLANGDFQNRVHISSNDEFEHIAKELNMASAMLKEAVERGDFAENSKNQLILNLAHDLRTPLTSVLGYLDLLVKDDTLTEEQASQYTMIALSKARRLEKLINELFEVANMSIGKLNVDKKRLRLNQLLMQLNEELYPLFEQNHLESRLHLQTDLEIFGDGDLLARMFENLLNNAIRHGKDGVFIEINGYMDGDAAVVEVINFGEPIPAGDLPFIFEMFYSGDQARSRSGGGTGLGLFIAKNIAEQHGGTVSAASDPRRTVFKVRLPSHLPSDL